MNKLKPELSMKNENWIEKHRYYELKHFCLQYPTWVLEYNKNDSITRANYELKNKTNDVVDRTSKCAEKRLIYEKNIRLIKAVIHKTAPDIEQFLLKGVTEGRSYDNLKTLYNLPASREYYYERYRNFFWLLDKYRK